jgi:hypothetical protein
VRADRGLRRRRAGNTVRAQLDGEGGHHLGAAQTGREKFVAMLREASDEVVRRKTAGRPPVVRDLATMAAGMKSMPPLMQGDGHCSLRYVMEG